MKNKYKFEKLRIGTEFYFISDTTKEKYTKVDSNKAYAERQEKLIDCYDQDTVIIVK